MAGILEARRIGLLPEDSMGRIGIEGGLAEKEHFDGGQFRRRCGELYAYQGYVDCAQCPDWEDTGSIQAGFRNTRRLSSAIPSISSGTSIGTNETSENPASVARAVISSCVREKQ